MYKPNNPEQGYIPAGYQEFVNKSSERLTAHFGNYSGGYQPQPARLNADYNSD
jgi:hypothetical protein